MKKMASFLIVLIFTLSCASSTRHIKSEVWKNPDIGRIQNIKYIILPFEDHNTAEGKFNYPQAKNVIYDAFETAMLSGGYEIVEYTQLEKEIVKKGGDVENKNSLVLDYALKLGATAVIHGYLTDYYQGSFFGGYTTVGFSVKALGIENGQILWKAERSKKMQWDYDYDPAFLAKELAKEMIQELSIN
ncbi:hypothetical protein JW835_09195 [bacterium]|nr:hypothetical protein [bacterium]